MCVRIFKYMKYESYYKTFKRNCLYYSDAKYNFENKIKTLAPKIYFDEDICNISKEL